METTTKKRALICIDFINEMVSKNGKLAGKGYLSFVDAHNTLQNLRALQDECRANRIDVIHVKLSFSDSYMEHPRQSPLLGKAREFGALQSGAWGTDFAELVQPRDNEKIIIKRRISAFYGTELELVLRNLGITTLIFAGVATDLAIESAARDAHDRDFSVIVAKDCCAAANEEDHMNSLKTIGKIASVTSGAHLQD